MAYIYSKPLQSPIPKPTKRTNLDDLIDLANSMKVGEAAVLTNSEAQTFRIILAAQGFHCATDGWRCDAEPKGRTLAFKLKKA